MKKYPSYLITRLLKKLNKAAGYPEAEEILADLKTAIRTQDDMGWRSYGWMLMISKSTSISGEITTLNSNGGWVERDNHYELTAKKLNHLKEAFFIFMNAGANPLPVMSRMMDIAHLKWLTEGVFNKIIEEENSNPLRTKKGDTLLHLVASVAMYPYSKFNDDAPSPHLTQWPVEWINLPRNSDGATPLHLVWNQKEGAIKRSFDCLNGDPLQGDAHWLIYQYTTDAILISKYLVDLGASWEATDHHGIAVGDQLLDAYENGVNRWLSNEAGVDWILSQITIQKASRENRLLESQTSYPKTKSKQQKRL